MDPLIVDISSRKNEIFKRQFQPFLFFLKLMTHCLQNEWPQSSDNIGDFIMSVHTGHSNKSGSIAKNNY